MTDKAIRWELKAAYRENTPAATLEELGPVFGQTEAELKANLEVSPGIWREKLGTSDLD